MTTSFIGFRSRRNQKATMWGEEKQTPTIAVAEYKLQSPKDTQQHKPAKSRFFFMKKTNIKRSILAKDDFPKEKRTSPYHKLLADPSTILGRTQTMRTLRRRIYIRGTVSGSGQHKMCSWRTQSWVSRTWSRHHWRHQSLRLCSFHLDTSLSYRVLIPVASLKRRICRQTLEPFVLHGDAEIREGMAADGHGIFLIQS